MLKFIKIKNNRGAVAILATMLILSFIIMVVLIVSRLIAQEIRLARDVAGSLKAYEAAVSGLERGLWEVKPPRDFPDGSSFSDNVGDGSYEVKRDLNRLISTGKYSDLERQLEVEL